MTDKRYVVRPSRVVSQSDGQVHFISAGRLIELHGVDPRKCVVIPPGEEWPRGYDRDFLRSLTWLTPAYRGNYGEDT